MGQGDGAKADQAAVTAMRRELDSVPINGTIVIGEGERDEAPMLFIGEKVGMNAGPQVDIAVDPLEGTTLCAKNMPGAIATMAMADGGRAPWYLGLLLTVGCGAVGVPLARLLRIPAGGLLGPMTVALGLTLTGVAGGAGPPSALVELAYAVIGWQAGVPIELIVRGICRLRPGVPGLSEGIRVVSLVGRFLEHARIYRFTNGGDAEYFIGSADWRPRNLRRRIETAAPVVDAECRARLDTILDRELADPSAWILRADGTYHRASTAAATRSHAQSAFAAEAEADLALA
jgi:hypothetical protein